METHLRGLRWAVLAAVGAIWIGCMVKPAFAVLHEPEPNLRGIGLGSLAMLVVTYGAVVHDVARRPVAQGTNAEFGATRRWPPQAFAFAVLLSLACVAPRGPDDQYTWAWVGGAVAGTTPLMHHGRARWMSAVGTVGIAVVVGVFTGGSLVVHGLIAASIAAVLVATSVLPLWMWNLLLLARTARDAQARLVVTNERLRFARDVHDVLGHRLTVIALKAELSARLSDRNPAEAARHANDVQVLASCALTEVREAVHGYRSINLARQIEATVSTLRDAGVECSVAGEDVGLPSAPDEIFALVLREASTNILRHSTARWCRISVGLNARETRMTIANDGAGPDPKPADDRSSGLQGLAERLAPLNGTIDTGRDGGVFTLTVTLPTK